MKEKKTLSNKSRWCYEHKQHHVVGSGMYKKCFQESGETTKSLEEEKAAPLEDKTSPSEEKAIPPEEKVPILEMKAAPIEVKPAPLTFSSEIYISGFSEESVLKCTLKESAPDAVTVRAPFYAGGIRIFYKEQQPFKVTLSEFSSVLDRGEQLFKLIK